MRYIIIIILSIASTAASAQFRNFDQSKIQGRNPALDPIPVVVYCGQSNAEGTGLTTSLSAHYSSVTDSFLVWHNTATGVSAGADSLKVFQPGEVIYRAFVAGRHSSEISLVRDMIDSTIHDTVILFKIAESGRRLAEGQTGGDWNYNTDSNGDLWETFKTNWASFQTTLYRMGKWPDVKVIVWWQGEADSVEETLTNEYEDNLYELIKHMRELIEAGNDVPFWQMEVDTFGYDVNVQKQSYTDKYDNSYMFDILPTYLTPGLVHLNSANFIAVGKLIEQAIR